MQTETLVVMGMNCAHCEKAVTNALEDIGASSVTASSSNKTVQVSFDPTKLTLDDIKKEITETGYKVQ